MIGLGWSFRYLYVGRYIHISVQYIKLNRYLGPFPVFPFFLFIFEGRSDVLGTLYKEQRPSEVVTGPGCPT